MTTHAIAASASRLSSSPSATEIFPAAASCCTRALKALRDLGSTPAAVRPFMAGRTLIRSAQFSRDRRWIVYASSDWGRDEIYVQDFPQMASRWQVSQNGGLNPLWTHDGRALYYRRGATLYRVPVEPAGTALKFGITTQIYTALPAVKGDRRAFGVFPNGDALVLKESGAITSICSSTGRCTGWGLGDWDPPAAATHYPFEHGDRILR